jgi:hypothetical protein
MMIAGAAALFGLLVVFVGVVLTQRKRQWQRTASLQNLLDLADQLEGDLKTCRTGLQQAHAVMSLNPDTPQASEKDARQAIDAGLRALLQQRLWIRDCSAWASRQQLEQTAQSMRDTRARLQPLVAALSQAQHDLDNAMREHIQREPGA